MICIPDDVMQAAMTDSGHRACVLNCLVVDLLQAVDNAPIGNGHAERKLLETASDVRRVLTVLYPQE